MTREEFAFILAFAAGLSTCVGAAVVYSKTLVQLASKKVLAGGLGMSAGVMLYVSFVEILFKSSTAFENSGSSEGEARLYATLCFFSGMVVMLALSYLVSFLDPGRGHCVCDEDENVDLDRLERILNAEASGESLSILGVGIGNGADEQPLDPKTKTNDDNNGDSNKNTTVTHLDIEMQQVSLNQQEQQQANSSSPKSGKPSSPKFKAESSHGLGGTHDIKGSYSNMHLLARSADIDTELDNAEQQEHKHDHEHDHNKLEHGDSKLHHMGVMTAIAIGLHNLPEGLATFVVALEDPGVGISLAFAIAIHNIPEGICVSVPIFFATGNRNKAFLWAFISGISEVVGALLGWVLLASIMGEVIYGILFGLISGMMVYLCIFQLIPTAHRYDPQDGVVSKGIIVGMVIMAFSLVLFLF